MGDPKMRLFVVVVVADAVVVDTTSIKHPLNSIQETSISRMGVRMGGGGGVLGTGGSDRFRVIKHLHNAYTRSDTECGPPSVFACVRATVASVGLLNRI